MNHWFLVGRDVMWLFISFAPLYLSAWFGKSLKQDDDTEPNDFWSIMLAAAIQTSLLLGLVSGVIR